MGGAKKIVWPVKELDLFREYGLKDLHFKGDYRSVLRIGNGLKDYALKRVVHSDEKLLSLVKVQKFLEDRGFANFARIIPNVKGEYFINPGNEKYFVMEWINGRESNFKNHNDLLTYVSVIGNLHGLTSDFGVATEDLREKWTSKLERLKKVSESPNDMPVESLGLIPGVIEFGQIALNILQNQEVLRSTCQPLVVCHRDLTSRNFLICPNQEGYLIDFDYARPDLPVSDLAKLLRMIWKENNGDIDPGLFLLSSYSKENPLSKGDLGVLLAYLYFPRHLRQFISRIKKHHTNPAIVNNTVKNVESYLAIKPFLDRFAKRIGY